METANMVPHLTHPLTGEVPKENGEIVPKLPKCVSNMGTKRSGSTVSDHTPKFRRTSSLQGKPFAHTGSATDSEFGRSMSNEEQVPVKRSCAIMLELDLNLYYVSRSLHVPDHPKQSMAAPQSAQESVDECWPPNLSQIEIHVNEDWDVQLEGRRWSHFEASSSNAFFQHQSMDKYNDNVHHAAESPWWARAGQELPETETSSLKAGFQEPSKSLFQKWGGRSYTSDTGTEDDQEEWGGT